MSSDFCFDSCYYTADMLVRIVVVSMVQDQTLDLMYLCFTKLEYSFPQKMSHRLQDVCGDFLNLKTL
jgi:hypothetical protein